MTDHDLLRKFIDAADQRAFEQLVDRHIHLVYGIARRNSPADADDITQAVFLLLSQKPRQARRHSSLAGWLFRATRYCCLNARRAERRRKHHEQKAGDAMPITSPAAENDLIALLDDALAALPRSYRDAVLLRYLEAHSVDDTADILGISQAAAGKRATRGLDILRDYFTNHGYTTTAAALTGALAAETAHAAPAHIVVSAKATTTAAATTKTLLLTKMTAKTMSATATKITVMSAVIAAIGITTATLATAHRNTPPAPLPNAAISTPAIVPATNPSPTLPPADETKVSGTMAIANYSVLLDPVAADDLRKIITPLPGGVSFYTLAYGNAQQIRESLKASQQDHHLIATADFFRRQQMDQIQRQIGGQQTFWAIKRPAVTWYLNIYLPMESAQAKSNGNSVEFHLNVANQQIVLSAQDKSGAMLDDLPNTIAAHWDGRLLPGDALVLIGDFGERHGDHLLTAVVYEVYKATDYQQGYFNSMLDSATWIEQGPTGLRQWADTAWAWSHSDTRSPADRDKTAAKWSRTLSDGAVVTLCGVARPSRWPFCWWDGDGFPTPGNYNNGSFNHQPAGLSSPLAAAVCLRHPGATSAPAGNDWEHDEYFRGRAIAVPEDAQRVAVYIPIGPWTEHEMNRGDSVELGDHELVLGTQKASDTACFALLRGDWSPDYEAKVSAILQDGKRVEDHNTRWNFLTLAGDEAEMKVEGYFEVPLKNIDHFVVATRHREAAKFEGFTTAPVVVPTLPTTNALTAANQLAAQSAEKAIADEREAEWERAKGKWAGFAAIPRDETTPDGAMRILMDKANDGDVAGVQARLIGKDSEVVRLMAEGLAGYQHAWSLGVRKFGEEALRRAAARQDTDMSLEDEYLGRAWKVAGDRASDPQGASQLVRIDGKWRLDVTPVLGGMPKAKLASMVQQMQEKGKQLERDLNSGRIADVSSLVKRFGEIAAAATEEEPDTQPAK